MAEVRGERRNERSSFTALDASTLGAAALGLAAVWGLQLFVAPSFAAMYADFGADAASLPATTQLIVRPILAGVASLVVVVALGAGLALRFANRSTIGGAALALAVLLAWAAVPVMVYALYAPIWTLSAEIRP